MIFGDQPGEWTPEDVLLANALTVLEAETCRECGTPVWWGYSTDNTLQFKIETSHCYACEALEKEREARSKNRANKGHGDTPYVVAYNFFEDQPLPSRRASYEQRKG